MVLPEGHRAFLARPGEQSKYFDLFREMEAIGPDLPFVELQRGVPVDEHDDLDHMLKRAMAFRRPKSKAAFEGPPSENLGDYVAARRVQAPAAAQFRRILKGYFESAQKGDLALIPPSAWRSEALLVEFSGGPGNIVYRKVPYGDTLLVDIPARRFREIATVTKRLLPPHILDVVTKPNAFVQFGRSDTTDLHDLAYGSFVREEEYSSTFYVTNPEYNLEHDLLFAAFVKFVAANSKAVAEATEAPYTLEDSFLGRVRRLHAEPPIQREFSGLAEAEGRAEHSTDRGRALQSGCRGRRRNNPICRARDDHHWEFYGPRGRSLRGSGSARSS